MTETVEAFCACPDPCAKHAPAAPAVEADVQSAAIVTENALLRSLLIEIMAAAKPLAAAGAQLQEIAAKARAERIAGVASPPRRKGPEILPSELVTLAKAWAHVLKEAPKE